MPNLKARKLILFEFFPQLFKKAFIAIIKMFESMRMKKLIIFDMDDVIYHYDFMARRENLAQESGISIAHISQKWFDAGMENRAEAGFHKDGNHYLQDFNQILGTDFNRATWTLCRKRAMRPIFKTLEMASRLKSKGHEIAILTNNGALVYEEMPNLAPEAYEIFGDNSYCSWNFGARKPSKKVFENALNHFGFAAPDTYFIDDMLENANGAQSIGINSIHFTPQTNLEDRLSELL